MIAGPYRSGGDDPAEHARRLRELNSAAHAVFRKGHLPVIGVNMALPVIDAAGERYYEELMMPISLALAERCDGVLRMGGKSDGADQEVELIRSRGGAVFFSLEEVPD